MAQRPKAKPKRKSRKSTAGSTDKAQSARFIETARMLGSDENRQKFSDAMEKLLPPKRAKRNLD
jgi:hypothetical protein